MPFRDTAPPSADHQSPKPVSRWLPGRDWFAATPVIAILLIVVLVGVLLWAIDRDEREERHLALIQDALWVEQSLRFQLGAIQDAAERLAQDADHDGRFRQRGAQILTSFREVEQILWCDGSGQTLAGVPLPAACPHAGEGADLILRVRQYARSVYGTPTRGPDGQVLLALAVPVPGTNGMAGFLLVQLRLAALIHQNVPWWVAEKYQIAALDGDGQVLASKSTLPVEHSAVGYSIALDPAIQGWSLVITPYRVKTELAHSGLMLAILVLALVAGFSLWARHRYIRQRLAAEQALRSEYAFRRAMEESIAIGMRARALDGRIIYVNQAFCRMIGWDRAELIGRYPPMPYWLPDQHEQAMERHRAVLEGHAPRDGFEMRFRRRSGEEFDALIYETPLIDGRGQQVGWMGSVLDITERKAAEQALADYRDALQRSARLVAMGEMATMLAHQLNQPLAALTSYATGCLNRLESAPPSLPEWRKVMGKMVDQARRAGEIVQHIRDFVQRREPSMAPLDLAAALRQCLRLMEPEFLRHGIRCTNDLPEAPVMVAGDGVLIEQALVNLLRNALDAVGAPDRLAPDILVRLSVLDERAAVEILDRGGGVPPAVRDRLFQPFMTTKPDGMGIGLNICRSIAESHHGSMSYEPLAAGGSLFRLTLPVMRR